VRSRKQGVVPVAKSRTEPMTRTFDVSPAPHVIAGFTIPRVMFQVLLALVPVVVAQFVILGPGVLLQLLVAGPVALACEALALRLRGRDSAPFLRDGSVLVTAALLAVAVPPLLPWWLTALGIAVAVLLGKHAYGGLGFNPFNPAMVGYAVLLVSFPVEMTRWPAPPSSSTHDWLELARVTWQSFSGASLSSPGGFDAYTGATALDALRTGLGQRFTMQEIFAGPAFGSLGGAGAPWVNLAALAGGLYLLARRLVRWHIPVAVLAGIAMPAAMMHALDPGAHASATFQLLSGATMLGAFFIATDPVSAATSDRGRLIYGAGIGAITWIIRTWGGYPDGIAFAVLLMNLAAPLIDRYTVPRIHGHA
jgi:electron transport complex protein RnfD